MAQISLTAEQQQAVDNRGGSLLVSAAAGSGKTRVLVERLFAHIQREQCNVDDFLMITYTRAAAAELRGKIAAELSARVARQPEDDHLRRQLLRVYRADIKTVDAFCGSLLRENTHLLRPVDGRSLTPDFRVLDEQEGQVLRSRVLERVVEDFYQKIQDGDQRARLLADTLGAGRDDRRLTELVLELYDKLQSHPYPLRWLAEQRRQWEHLPEHLADTPYGRIMMDRTLSAAAFWEEKLRSAAREMEQYPKVQRAYQGPFLAVAEALSTYPAAAARGFDAMGEVDPAFPRLGAVRNAEDEAFKERMKALKDRCAKAVKAQQAVYAVGEEAYLEDLREMGPAILALMELTASFTAAYQKEKVRRNCADFSDQEHYAIEILTTPDGAPTDLARQVAGRYREIMVDEYQDTNEVQNCIFSAISRQEQNLFTVGDVKQSIYRFRLAQPDIFLEKYRAYADAAAAGEGKPRRVLLKRNFRSRGTVLEATNFVFRGIMSRQMGELDYGEAEQLYTGADYYPPVPDRETELHLVSIEDTAEQQFDRTRCEMEFVAGTIRRLLDEGDPVLGADGALHPVRPEDIVVLMRSPRARMQELTRALERQGIPFSGGEGEPFFQTVEISTVYSLLQIIDNPRQDVPLIAVLRSPLFGFTPDLLARVRACRTGDFYDACLACTEQPVRQFMATLEQLRELAQEEPADRLLWQMYDRLHILGVFGAMEDGELRRSRLLNLCAYAEKLAETGRITVFELTEYLRSLMQQGKEPPLAAGLRPGGVTVMSIHRSKGLEFPVVILCDLNKQFNREDLKHPVLVHPQMGLGTERVDLARHIRYDSISKTAIALKLEEEALSEEMRILYVAMTRAKEKLILLDCMKGALRHVTELAHMAQYPVPPEQVRSAKSMGDWVLMALLCATEAGSLHRWTGVYPPDRQSAGSWRVYVHENPSFAAAAAEVQTAQAAPELPFDPELLEWTYPHEVACRVPSKVTATQLKGRELDLEIADGAAVRPTGGAFPKPRFLSREHRLTAAEQGTAMHLVMQYLPFDTPANSDAVARQVHVLQERRLLTEEQAASIRCDRIAAFLQSELCGRIRSANRVWREYRFALLVEAALYDPAAAGEEMMLQGVADVCFETAEGLVIADFKTDRLAAGEALQRAQRYRPQLEAYSRALSRVLEKPVVERVLYFFSTGETIGL